MPAPAPETHEVHLPIFSRILRVVRGADAGILERARAHIERRVKDLKRAWRGFRRRRAIRHAFTSLASLLAVVGFGSACRTRPAPGGGCRVADQLVCSSKDEAFVCESTVDPAASVAAAASASAAPPPAANPGLAWVDIPCKGTRGCGRTGDDDACDDTLAAAGDPCPRSPPLDYACATNRGDALVCRDGHFDLWRHCRGPQGCRVLDGRNVHCDT
jgi:hypothetical protein